MIKNSDLLSTGKDEIVLDSKNNHWRRRLSSASVSQLRLARKYSLLFSIVGFVFSGSYFGVWIYGIITSHDWRISLVPWMIRIIVLFFSSTILLIRDAIGKVEIERSQVQLEILRRKEKKERKKKLPKRQKNYH